MFVCSEKCWVKRGGMGRRSFNFLPWVSETVRVFQILSTDPLSIGHGRDTYHQSSASKLEGVVR